MISNVIVIAFFSIALPASIKYLVKLRAVTSIMRIPLRFVFSSFPILMISTVLRSAYRLVLDFKAFRTKSYVQSYNTEEGDGLI
jgi:TRAP-type C4-dicarboxylate transport system permease small subunit